MVLQQARAVLGAAAAAPPAGRRSCGRTRSRRCAASPRRGGSSTAIRPKNTVLPSISSAARAWLPCAVTRLTSAPMMRGSGSSATPKRAVHRGGDAARQLEQLRAAGAAVVDQHQRMRGRTRRRRRRDGPSSRRLSISQAADSLRVAVAVAAEHRQRRMRAPAARRRWPAARSGS